MAQSKRRKMAEEQKGSSLLRLALGAGLLAAAAVSVAVFVPRRRWQAVAAPLRGAAVPAFAAVTAWAVNLWDEVTAPTPPVFDDLRPFDEF
jgi:hypothetical protein